MFCHVDGSAWQVASYARGSAALAYRPDGVPTIAFIGQDDSVHYAVEEAALAAEPPRSSPRPPLAALLRNPAQHLVVFQLGQDATQSAEPISINIFDMQGRLVRTLRRNAPHPDRLSWDGTADNGRRVFSGTYLCRIQLGRRTEDHKATLLE
jgi:hypothetical protein